MIIVSESAATLKGFLAHTVCASRLLVEVFADTSALRVCQLVHYDSGMSRRPRVLRRILLATAIPVLLVLGYIGTWLAVSRAEHDGFITSQTVQIARPVFAPLISYGESGRPGAGLLRELWWLMNPPVWQVFSSGSGDAVVTGSFVVNSPIAPPHPDAVPASGQPH